jgi:4-amino-4-deoxy-L-arabinose transferase-like glycosyltransferase
MKISRMVRKFISRWGTVLLLTLAFGLRMARISGRSLWYDEAFAVLYGSLDHADMVYGTVTPVEGAGAADVHPLLYYFSLHAWMGVVGGSPFAARFFSVLLGMLTVALLWRLAAWCFGRRTGLAVGVLAAVNPFHVAYSQEARMYALLGFATVLAAWGLLRALEEGRFRWWGAYVLGAALTLYAHNLGAFVLIALNLLAVLRRRWWRRLPALVLAGLAALVLYGPWMIGVLPGQLGFIERAYWLSPPGAGEAIRALMMPVLTLYEDVRAFWLLGVGFFVSVLVLVLLILRAWRTRSRASWFVVLCWVPVGALFLVAQWRPVYLERALLPSALFYLVAIGWLLAQGGLPRWLSLGLSTALLLVTSGMLWNHYTYTGFPRPPFREAVAYLQTHVEEGDAVVHTNKLTFFPMRVYEARLPGKFLADPPGSPQDTLAFPTQEALGIFATPTMAEAVGEAERVWLVYFPLEVEQMGGEHPALTWLGEGFVETERMPVGDLVLALYQREGW